MNLTKWVILLAIVATFDLLTTYFAMSPESLEINPLFRNANIEVMVLAKIVGIALLISLSFHFKQKVVLITGTAVNSVAVAINTTTILLMR